MSQNSAYRTRNGLGPDRIDMPWKTYPAPTPYSPYFPFRAILNSLNLIAEYSEIPIKNLQTHPPGICKLYPILLAVHAPPEIHLPNTPK